MISLVRRDRQSEWMDQPDIDLQLHLQALVGLRRINSFSSSTWHLWRVLESLARKHAATRLRVLDVACGGGDVLIRLACRAHRANRQIQFFGCDLSRTAISAAREAAQKANVAGVDFFQHDALQGEFPTKYDVVMCSLFLHHLSELDAARILGRMAAAAERAVLVDDLLRTRLGYVLAWAGCRLLSRSPVVHKDGPLSVRGAFTWEEAQALATQAGLTGAQFLRHWPERFLMQWSRS